MSNEKQVVTKIVQNGVTRPKDGTKTARVWEIADELSAAAGKPAKRKDVIAKILEEGGNPATAATQYGRWRKFNGLQGSDEVDEQMELDLEAEVEAETAV